ncbi:N-acetyltransferase [Neisseria sp. N95_16]|uniref:GNAT family N-acetyltransferase n=1 Tax=Neisseria brasiliensis TaxID=2666100 RepID=A0A5Q3S0H6_9NEIS|nr:MULTISPECIES: GNAT family N-acetyltransferase [Neisseria]MRN38455.1 GNAT family N-acetyltransferase [Neisseria brasiliensis]PJO08960.1 N-acetyltransferase [Neisseria sp. N95_16]PJO77370.1 N-acetyltransferase [Neisseria sp. N177_16]QGL25445.1 GNAT family N-acetyltransferase [Neisseria brasiliensis]
MQYVVAEAVQDDLPAIVAIYNSTIESRQSTADLQSVTVAERQAWFDAHGGKRPLLVLRDVRNEIVAWGSFSDYYPRQAYHISAEISVYVRQDVRGVGVGKVLLRYMLERAPSLGIRNVLAVIFGHNHASIRLFRSFGFEEWGRLPQVCDLETQLADIVILGKKILD